MRRLIMRAFTKSVLSYTWATSLFGLQETARFLLPQTWFETDRVAKPFERITKATAEELGSVAGSTFRIGDNLQRGSVDLVSTFLTLGGASGSDASGSTNASASTATSNLG